MSINWKENGRKADILHCERQLFDSVSNLWSVRYNRCLLPSSGEKGKIRADEVEHWNKYFLARIEQYAKTLFFYRNN